jgi:hypothetical protein
LQLHGDVTWLSDETLPNSINEKTPIQNEKGRNNKKRPMSNQGITPEKM